MPFLVNVPKVAGVPAVFFSGVQQAISLASSDLVGLGLQTSAWGIYGGSSGVAVTAESVVALDFKKDWAISDFPVERGAYESYDKVATPFSARVRLASGGSVAAREALLDSIQAIAGDLNLYDVVCPEAVYTNANISHYDFRRANENGRGLMIVDVWLEEIRVTAAAATSAQTADPSGAASQNTGTVQPIDQSSSTAPGLTQFAPTSSGYAAGAGGTAGLGTISPIGGNGSLPSMAFINQPLT